MKLHLKFLLLSLSLQFLATAAFAAECKKTLTEKPAEECFANASLCEMKLTSPVANPGMEAAKREIAAKLSKGNTNGTNWNQEVNISTGANDSEIVALYKNEMDPSRPKGLQLAVFSTTGEVKEWFDLSKEKFKPKMPEWAVGMYTNLLVTKKGKILFSLSSNTPGTLPVSYFFDRISKKQFGFSGSPVFDAENESGTLVNTNNEEKPTGYFDYAQKKMAVIPADLGKIGITYFWPEYQIISSEGETFDAKTGKLLSKKFIYPSSIGLVAEDSNAPKEKRFSKIRINDSCQSDAEYRP